MTGTTSLPASAMTADLSSSRVFGRLQSLVSEALGVDLRGNTLDVCNLLSQQGPVDLRMNIPLMLQVEALLPGLLHEFGFSISAFGSVQFPANIRVVESRNNSNPDANYRTDYIHCDSWSGAPLDSFNLFVYLFVSPESPYLAMYEFRDPSQFAMDRFASYSEISVDQKDLRALPFPTEVGSGAIWPTATPHRTVIPKTCLSAAWRVSLDVRFRAGSPYSHDSNVPFDEFARSRMTSGGVYWDSATLGSTTMKEKAKRELELTESHGLWATTMRHQYLEAWYPELEIL